MNSKKTAFLLSAFLLAALLTGCGSPIISPTGVIPTISASVPSPSMTRSSALSPSILSPLTSSAPSSSIVKTSFLGKVKAISGSTLTLDVQNNSFKTSLNGETPMTGPPGTAAPSAGTGITVNLPVVIPDTAVVILTSGSKGALSDVRAGNTISVTMEDQEISQVTVVS